MEASSSERAASKLHIVILYQQKTIKNQINYLTSGSQTYNLISYQVNCLTNLADFPPNH